MSTQDRAATSTATSSPGADASQGKSLGELVAQVTDDLTTLLRQELALAKAEMRQEAGKAGRGAAMLAGAAVAALLTLMYLSEAAVDALANVMDRGWAALIVAVIWAVVTAVLVVAGRSALRQIEPKPERTIDTLSKAPSALKGHGA
jgi:hypothetical protein